LFVAVVYSVNFREKKRKFHFIEKSMRCHKLILAFNVKIIS